MDTTMATMATQTMDTTSITQEISTKINGAKTACVRYVPMDKIQWYQYMLIPAVVCIIIFAFLRRRQNLCLKCLNGRPGLPRPLNFLDDKQNRFFYVGAFCVTAWMLQKVAMSEMAFGIKQRFGITVYSEYWTRILSCVLVAIICYPIFGGVSSDHVVSYAVGTLYVWVLTITYSMLNFPCKHVVEATADLYEQTKGILNLVEFIPCLVWLLYLSVVYPYRLYLHIKRKRIAIGFTTAKGSGEELPYLFYVRKVLSKRRIEEKAPAVYNWPLIGRALKKIYVPIKGFRYSVSMLTAVFVSIMLVYTTSLNLVQLVVVEEWASQNITSAKDHLGGDFGRLAVLRDVMKFLLPSHDEASNSTAAKTLIKTPFYASISLASILTTISLLLTLKEHRKNLLNSYKGIFADLPTYEKSPRSIMVDAFKYVGYQFGFAIWGLIVQAIFITLAIFFVASVFILFVTNHPYKNIPIELLLLYLYTKIFQLVQHLVVHLFFQQRDEKGHRLLAVDNRSVFVNWQYFMIFPNTTHGFIASLQRIAKAIVFSLWILPRLDRCPVSRQYEQRDSAFTAYIGLLKMESSQTNPSMLTFVYLLLKSLQEPKLASRPKPKRSRISALLQSITNTIYRGRSPSPGVVANSALSEKDQLARRKLARNRWFLWVTLIRNPGLTLLRKGAASRSSEKTKTATKADAVPNVEDPKKAEVGTALKSVRSISIKSTTLKKE